MDGGQARRGGAEARRARWWQARAKGGPPFLPDEFLSVQNERVLGPDIPSHCRPAFFICIQCRRHPRLEPSPLPAPAPRTALRLPRRLDDPTYHRNIVNMPAHRNYRTRDRTESQGRRRSLVARAETYEQFFAYEYFRPKFLLAPGLPPDDSNDRVPSSRTQKEERRAPTVWEIGKSGRRTEGKEESSIKSRRSSS